MISFYGPYNTFYGFWSYYFYCKVNRALYGVDFLKRGVLLQGGVISGLGTFRVVYGCCLFFHGFSVSFFTPVICGGAGNIEEYRSIAFGAAR